MFKPDEYVVGGTVQAGDGVYIEREADQELLVLCRTRAFVYILSTRQVGKSSLIINVAKTLVAEGIAPVIIDLQESGVHELTADTWYIGFLTEVSDQLELDVDVENWWGERNNLPHGKRFTTFFKEILLAQVKKPVVVFVDEIDTTRSLTFADDFYTAIRSIYNSRAIVPEFQRLSFVLVGAAAPTDLIRDTKRTPFNIGQRVELTDFTFDETLPLATRLGLPESTTRQITYYVLSWTSGHPYLTLALFRQIAEGVKTGKKEWTSQDVDAIVAQNFFGGQEDSNLRFVRDMLTIHAPDSERVLTTYRDIYREKSPVVDEERSPIKAHLKLAGVVRSENGDLRIRNRIYREIYDEDWIRKHLPVNWTRRLQRVASVAVALFFIALLPLSIYAWSQKNKAENALAAAYDAREKAELAAKREADARLEAELAAKSESMARRKAEEAERLEADARRQAEKLASSEKEARLEATESAAAARAATQLAQSRLVDTQDAMLREQQARAAAQKAEAEARKAEEEAKNAKEQSEAKGQVAFARQLVIQAEAELEKNDTAAASAFFANALLLDDQEDTRSRLFNTLLQVAKPFWTTPASLQMPSVLAMNGDGSVLASLIDHREIVISDTQSGTIKRRIPERHNYGSQILLDSTGLTLVTVTNDYSESVPDPTTGQRIPAFDSKFTTYDVASGNILSKVSYQTLTRPYALSRDGKLAVVEAIDGTTQILNVQTGKPQTLPVSGQSSFTFSPNGEVLAATKNNDLYLWDLRRNLAPRVLNDAALTGVTNEDRSRIGFSPDGKQIVHYRESVNPIPNSGGTQNVAALLTVWDVAAGKSVSKLTTTEPVTNFAFTANSSHVVLMTYSVKVLRWDTKEDQTVEVVGTEFSPISVVGGVFSHDGRKFAAHNGGSDYQIYSVDGMKLSGTVSIINKPIGHSTTVNSVAFDPRGEFVASSGNDSRVILWNAATGQMVRTLSESVSINSVAFSADGTWLAYAGYTSGNIHLWNRDTDERKVVSTTVSINSLAFSPTESLLAAGAVNGEILIWTPKQETIQALAQEPTPSPTPAAGAPPLARAVISIDFSQDGMWLAAVRNDDPGVVRFYDMPSRALAHTFRNGNDVFQSLAFGSNQTFATASHGGTVRLWQIKSTAKASWVIQEVYVLPVKFGPETTITISPDGQRLALANRGFVAGQPAASQYAVRVWDVNSQQWLTSVRGEFEGVGVQFSREGRFLAAGATDGKVRLWEVKETLPFSAVNAFSIHAVSDDGELVATFERSASGTVIVVRNLKDGRILQTLPAAPSASDPDSLSGEFSPDNKWFAADWSNTVRVWDLTNGKVQEIPTDGADTSDFLFSANSRLVIVGARSQTESGSKIGNDKAIVYELVSGKRSEVPFAGGFLWSLAISPDEKWLIMGGGGERPSDTKPKSIVVWNLEKNQQVFSWQGKIGAVLRLAFSAEQGQNKDQWVIATGEGNGNSNPRDETLRLIDFKTQKQLRTFPGFSEAVLSLAFSPRSSGYNFLVTAGSAFRAWNLESNGSAHLDTGLRLTTDRVPARPSFFSSGRFMVALAGGQVKSWDLKQVNLIMNSRPEDIVSYVTNLTQLNVHGLHELGFARLSQARLKALLGASFRSNFTVVQTPSPTVPADTMK